MLWFLSLHIIALLFWVASLLYLPVLLARVASNHTEITEYPHKHDSVARFVYTHIATPAALIGIVSGTIVFMLNWTLEAWLIAKLTLVTMLVACHTLTGLLVLRAEREKKGPLQPWCGIVLVTMIALVLAIFWLVLAKPPVPEVFPWHL